MIFVFLSIETVKILKLRFSFSNSSMDEGVERQSPFLAPNHEEMFFPEYGQKWSITMVNNDYQLFEEKTCTLFIIIMKSPSQTIW